MSDSEDPEVHEMFNKFLIETFNPDDKHSFKYYSYLYFDSFEFAWDLQQRKIDELQERLKQIEDKFLKLRQQVRGSNNGHN